MGKNIPNKVGKKYGELTVLKYLGELMYECQCSCGNIITVKTTNLRQDKRGTFRCSECQKEKNKTRIHYKKIGMRSGKLVVTKYLGNSKYECVCDCGNTTIVDSKDLVRTGKHKNVMSCGCTIPHYKKDETFFEKIDSEEKAYIAGFIAADGAVVYSKNGHGIKITLHNDDKDILEKISKAIRYTGPVKIKDVTTTLPQGNKCFSKICEIFIASKKMAEDLINIGITPKKSLTLKINCDKIPNKLIRHFLRGYWDGDGTIHVYRNKKQRIIYNATCLSSYLFCEQMKDILEKELNISCRLNHSKYNEDTGVLVISNKAYISLLENYLYKDATIYLDRKYQRYLRNERNLEKIFATKPKELKNLQLE